MAEDLLYKIKLKAEDDASRVIRAAAGQTEAATDRFVAMGKESEAAGAAAFVAFEVATNVIRELSNLVKGLGVATIETSARYESLTQLLESSTGGHGATYFEQLNAWAKELPANTEQAIGQFAKLRNAGINPTVRRMTTLVDAMAGLSKSEADLEGIVLALGQIQTKGKGSLEELGQLAERGVPAIDILREELQLTGQEVANIGNSAITAEQIIDALFTGLEKRYGGAAKGMQNTWGGLVNTLESEWADFLRLIGEAGAFDFAKERLIGLREAVKELAASGDLERYARQASEIMIGLGESVVWAAEQLAALSAAGLALGTSAAPWIRVLQVLSTLPGTPLSGWTPIIRALGDAYEAAARQSEAFAQSVSNIKGVYGEATAAVVEHYDALAESVQQATEDESAGALAVLAIREQQRDTVIALANQEAAARKASLDTQELDAEAYAAEVQAIEERLSESRVGALKAYAAGAQSIYDELGKQNRTLVDELKGLESSLLAFEKSSRDMVLGAALNAMTPAQQVETLKKEISTAQQELRDQAAKGDRDSLKNAEQGLRRLASLYRQLEGAVESPAGKEGVAREAARELAEAADTIRDAYGGMITQANAAKNANEQTMAAVKAAAGEARQDVVAATPKVEVQHNAATVKEEILQVLQGLETTGVHTVRLQGEDGQPYDPETYARQDGEIVMKAVTDAAAERIAQLTAPSTKHVAAEAGTEGAQAALDALTEPVKKPVTAQPDTQDAEDALGKLAAPEDKPVSILPAADAFESKMRELLKPEVKTIIVREVREGTSGDREPVPGYSSGVILPGFGGGDVIPARLEAGEAVLDKYTTRFFGPRTILDMQRVRKGQLSLQQFIASLQHKTFDLSIPMQRLTAPLAFSSGGLVPRAGGAGETPQYGVLRIELGGKGFDAHVAQDTMAEVAEHLKRSRLAGVSQAAR